MVRKAPLQLDMTRDPISGWWKSDRRHSFIIDRMVSSGIEFKLEAEMPAVSKKQQQFMGAELARKRAGKKTQTGMSAQQLEDFAGTKRKGLPTRAKGSKSNSKSNSGKRGK